MKFILLTLSLTSCSQVTQHHENRDTDLTPRAPYTVNRIEQPEATCFVAHAVSQSGESVSISCGQREKALASCKKKQLKKIASLQKQIAAMQSVEFK